MEKLCVESFRKDIIQTPFLSTSRLGRDLQDTCGTFLSITCGGWGLGTSSLARISKTNLSACQQPLWAALHQSRSTSTGPWRCFPHSLPKEWSHLRGETWLHLHRAPLAQLHVSAQAAPEAKDCCKELTEAAHTYQHVLVTLGRRTRSSRNTAENPTFCQLAGCQASRQNEIYFQQMPSTLRNEGLESNPDVKLSPAFH